MAASGPSEIILLSAGLIVAALVSGILLQTWDDMDDVLDERGKQGAERQGTGPYSANLLAGAACVTLYFRGFVLWCQS